MPRDNRSKEKTGSRKKVKRTTFSYTDEERETLRCGLLMLARLIARTHLRRQLSMYQSGAANKGKDRVP